MPERSIAETGERGGEELQPILCFVAQETSVPVFHHTSTRGSDVTRWIGRREELDAGNGEVAIDRCSKATDSDDKLF